MPPKRNEHFSRISDRQKRKRISAPRLDLRIANSTQDANSSSSSSSHEEPEEMEIIEVEDQQPLQNEINLIGQEQAEFPDEEEYYEEDTEFSEAETVSSNEEETDNEDPDAEREDHSGSSSDDDFLVAVEDITSVSRKKMKNAFLSARLTHIQGNIILKTLREIPFQLILPQDSRTVLNTPTFVATMFVQQVAGGEYLHMGFKDGLLQKLEIIPQNKLPEYVEIDFSTDGGNLDKNGSWKFWPHQFRNYNISDKRPMIAGVFKGRHKPSNAHDFFDVFITEINEVIRDGGILVRGRRLPLRIRCFIADAPLWFFLALDIDFEQLRIIAMALIKIIIKERVLYHFYPSI